MVRERLHTLIVPALDLDMCPIQCNAFCKNFRPQTLKVQPLSPWCACGGASNDAFDASTGVDGGKPESVVNLTGNRNGVLLLANAFLVAGAALLWRVITSAVRFQQYPVWPSTTRVVC